jgi:hypothetical protein
MTRSVLELSTCGVCLLELELVQVQENKHHKMAKEYPKLEAQQPSAPPPTPNR